MDPFFLRKTVFVFEPFFESNFNFFSIYFSRRYYVKMNGKSGFRDIKSRLFRPKAFFGKTVKSEEKKGPRQKCRTKQPNRPNRPN
jgi:hypothetical protein